MLVCWLSAVSESGGGAGGRQFVERGIRQHIDRVRLADAAMRRFHASDGAKMSAGK